MTIARINSCTVMSLSSAIFRSFVYAESPRDCMNLDNSIASSGSCPCYLPEPRSEREVGLNIRPSTNIIDRLIFCYIMIPRDIQFNPWDLGPKLCIMAFDSQELWPEGRSVL